MATPLETARRYFQAKRADLEPSAAWAGHADPVLGDVAGALRAAAAATPR